jgi:PAS domain S-box-containing protein
VETAPVGIVEVDPEGSIRWWNRAAAKIFAWSDFTEIFEGSGPELPPTVKERFLDLWSEALRGTLEGSRDLHDVEINGRQRHLNVSAVPLPSAGTETRSLLTLVDDVTNQRELKQELRHAHQMELRGQVASSVAHDFNNLLTLISGYAEILSQDLGGDNREMEMVRNIQSTASRASQLTGQLQAIGRTQSTESVVVDPVELIRANAEVLERIMGVDIRVTWLLDAGVANVKVDADQFEQMILNLAINARDAMPVGGRLTITARNETVDSRSSSILELPAGNYVVVSVADTGIGMDEETRRRCFEPLFTTKGPFNGTGMGLAAARRFVEESGGVIQCTSELQRGTSFDVLLPAVLDAAATSASHDEIARPRGSATVLLADDDEGLRTLMAQVLGRNGYVVIEAGSAEEALELARARTSPIDVLISDVVMGALSGPELARSLQNDDPLLRVLLISGTADATVVELLAEGTGQFLAKPFKPSELIDEVHGLLERPGPSS